MSSDPVGAFGAVLKRYRRAAGLTQEALAARAGLSVQGISALERGVNRTPRKDTVHLLAAALALTERDRAALLASGASWSAVTAPVSERASAPPPLVGRVREVALVERHLTLTGGPPLLVLAGEPGIGKTRLLQEATRRAGHGGWRVLAGGCQRRGGQEPYAPLLGALQRYLRRQRPPACGPTCAAVPGWCACCPSWPAGPSSRCLPGRCRRPRSVG